MADLQDVIDKLTGNTHKYVPPRGSIYTGSPANAKTYILQIVNTGYSYHIIAQF